MFEEFGFTRDRQIAKWRWVMRLETSTSSTSRHMSRAYGDRSVKPIAEAGSPRPASARLGIVWLSDSLLRAEVLGDMDREGADPTGDADDQDVLSGPESTGS